MLIKLVIAALIVSVVLLLLRPARPLFEIRIEGGEAEVRRGQVPGEFYRACRQIAERSPGLAGVVQGHAMEGGVNLRFSRTIPAPDRQRFRNAWHADV